MPRISPEARSAARFAAAGKPPKPPSSFSTAEAVLWSAIIISKPAGWFDAGSLPLLALYVRTLNAAGAAAILLADMPIGAVATAEAEGRLVALNASAAMLARKLRLTPQQLIERHSRILTERGAGDLADDQLLGGPSRWLS